MQCEMQLERMQGSMQSMYRRASLSTLTLTVNKYHAPWQPTPEALPDLSDWQLARTVRTGVSVLFHTARAVVHALLLSFIVLVPLALIAGALLYCCYSRACTASAARVVRESVSA